LASDTDKKRLSVVGNAAAGELMPPAPPWPPVKIARDLTKLTSVAREIARIYRAVRRGQMRSEEGTKATYILRQLAHVLEVTQIEKRLNEMERQLLGNNLPEPIEPDGSDKGNGDPIGADADTGDDSSDNGGQGYGEQA